MIARRHNEDYVFLMLIQCHHILILEDLLPLLLMDVPRNILLKTLIIVGDEEAHTG